MPCLASSEQYTCTCLLWFERFRKIQRFWLIWMKVKCVHPRGKFFKSENIILKQWISCAQHSPEHRHIKPFSEWWPLYRHTMITQFARMMSHHRYWGLNVYLWAVFRRKGEHDKICTEWFEIFHDSRQSIVLSFSFTFFLHLLIR